MLFLALYQSTRSAQQQFVGAWLLLLVSLGYLTLKWLVSPAQFPATKHLTFWQMFLNPLWQQKFSYGRMGGAASPFWISSCWHLPGPLNGIPCHIILLLAFLRARYWSSAALIKPHPSIQSLAGGQGLPFSVCLWGLCMPASWMWLSSNFFWCWPWPLAHLTSEGKRRGHAPGLSVVGMFSLILWMQTSVNRNIKRRD